MSKLSEAREYIDKTDQLLRSKTLLPSDRVLLYCFQRFCEAENLQPGSNIAIFHADFAEFCGIDDETAAEWLERLALPWAYYENGQPIILADVVQS